MGGALAEAGKEVLERKRRAGANECTEGVAAPEPGLAAFIRRSFFKGLLKKTDFFPIGEEGSEARVGDSKEWTEGVTSPETSEGSEAGAAGKARAATREDAEAEAKAPAAAGTASAAAGTTVRTEGAMSEETLFGLPEPCNSFLSGTLVSLSQLSGTFSPSGGLSQV